MNADRNGPGSEVVVTRPASEAWLVRLGFPLLGAAVGLAARPVVEWVLGLDWIPFRGPLELVESIPQPLGTIVLVAAGVVLGVLLVLTAEGEVLRVGVGADGVSLTRDGATRTVPRSAVAAVFTDGKALVLLGSDRDELARESSDLAAGRLADAFTVQGYPWHADGDPHRDEYRRWVEDTPDLPAGVNAVLRARDRAIAKGDKDDIADLRAELAKLGVVVRDEEKRQYWRRVKMGP